METTLRTINAVISALFFICYTYQFLYIPLVLAKKPKALSSPAKAHRYAVLIAAGTRRNVISGLLDSLRSQTYDMSQVTVFVAADNCTDRTAAIARGHGAVVYERFNHLNVGKGYALDFLLQHIGADYPAGFDGYFVFDADNIPRPGLHRADERDVLQRPRDRHQLPQQQELRRQLDQRRIRPVVFCGRAATSTVRAPGWAAAPPWAERASCSLSAF